jgi:hypothetical protein
MHDQIKRPLIHGVAHFHERMNVGAFDRVFGNISPAGAKPPACIDDHRPLRVGGYLPYVVKPDPVKVRPLGPTGRALLNLREDRAPGRHAGEPATERARW